MKHFFKKILVVIGMTTAFAGYYNNATPANLKKESLQDTALYEAAKAGDLRDQYRLGLKYLFNEDVNKQNDAFFWIHSAADQGYTPAQLVLAWMLANGIGGVEKNIESSRDWLELAAKNGNKDAQKVINGENFDKIIEEIKNNFNN